MIEIGRLDSVVVEAGFDSAHPIFGQAIRRERDECDGLAAGFAKIARDLISVHARHQKIKDYNVRAI